MDELDIFKLISAGGSTATMLILWALWKLDRRLIKIELRLFNGEKK